MARQESDQKSNTLLQTPYLNPVWFLGRCRPAAFILCFMACLVCAITGDTSSSSPNVRPGWLCSMAAAHRMSASWEGLYSLCGHFVGVFVNLQS